MRSSARSGFTLIEVIVAAFIFAVGVLALEATAVTALQRMRRSAELALAALVARSRLERLAATRCGDLTSGVDTVRTIVSVWTVQPTASATLRDVTQSIQYTVDGVDRADSYRAMVRCTP